MPVATFTQPNFTTQLGSTYKGNLDAAASVFTRIAGAFAPREQTTPNMTVRVDAGYVFSAGALTEVAVQSIGTITAPTTNPRIDRIVVDAPSGTAYYVPGTEAASPVAPAIPAEAVPVAQVLLQISSTVISNAMITDERLPIARPSPFAGVLARQGGTAQSLAGSSTDNVILFGSEDYDTNGAHVTSGSTGRITIPAGVRRAKFFGGLLANFVDGDNVSLVLIRGGIEGDVNPRIKSTAKGISATLDGIAFATPWMQNFSAGDYYEMVLRHSDATAVDTTPQGTYFGAEFMY